MKLLRHPVAALVLFATLIGLCLTIYSGFEEGYGLSEGDVKTIEGRTTGNIMEQFKSMNLISGISQIKSGIMEIKPPKGSGVQFDLLGGLASVGVGTLKSIVGLVTTPFEIVAIVLEYYVQIPAIITELVMMVVVYVGFILLSVYLKSDV